MALRMSWAAGYSLLPSVAGSKNDMSLYFSVIAPHFDNFNVISGEGRYIILLSVSTIIHIKHHIMRHERRNGERCNDISYFCNYVSVVTTGLKAQLLQMTNDKWQMRSL